MTIVVLGARGHLGQRVLTAVRSSHPRAVGGTHRTPSGSEVHADVRDPASLDARGVLINCADVLAARPDEAILRVLARGATWIETTAHPPTIERLLALRGRSDLPGTLVIGAGLFPGESNVLARAAADDLGGASACSSLEVAVRIVPASASGPALASLMAEMMTTPAVVYRDGARVEEPPLARGPDVAFPTVTSPSVRAPGCEPMMLHASLGIPNLTFLVAPAPTFAARLLRFLAPFLPIRLLRLRFVTRLNALYLSFLRTVLFRSRRAPIEIVATAQAHDGRTATRRLRVEQGMIATAEAIAATLDHLVESPRPGVHLPDELGYRALTSTREPSAPPPRSAPPIRPSAPPHRTA